MQWMMNRYHNVYHIDVYD